MGKEGKCERLEWRENDPENEKEEVNNLLLHVKKSE